MRTNNTLSSLLIITVFFSRYENINDVVLILREHMGSFSVVVGGFLWSVLLIFILVLISMLYFVLLRRVSCVSNVACVTELSILDCPVGVL